MGKNRDSTKTDFSSFMCIILMLTGCLVTILISNIVVIAANPNNVEITSVIGGTSAAGGDVDEAMDVTFGNITKAPWYLEVTRTYLTIYPGEKRVGIRELEERNNPFEEMLAKVEEKKDKQYIVLLVRPLASSFARQLKKIITDRGIEIGMDLLEGDLPIKFSGHEKPFSGDAETAPKEGGA